MARRRATRCNPRRPAALIRATPDGARAFDPRYGQADLFDTGTQAYFTTKFLF